MWTIVLIKGNAIDSRMYSRTSKKPMARGVVASNPEKVIAELRACNFYQSFPARDGSLILARQS